MITSLFLSVSPHPCGFFFLLVSFFGHEDLAKHI
jgi:hypothetical protein